MVICLGRGVDLHIAQNMPLPLTISCYSKSWYWLTWVVPDKALLNGHCCCLCILPYTLILHVITNTSPVTGFKPKRFRNGTIFLQYTKKQQWNNNTPDHKHRHLICTWKGSKSISNTNMSHTQISIINKPSFKIYLGMKGQCFDSLQDFDAVGLATKGLSPYKNLLI